MKKINRMAKQMQPHRPQPKQTGSVAKVRQATAKQQQRDPNLPLISSVNAWNNRREAIKRRKQRKQQADQAAEAAAEEKNLVYQVWCVDT